MGSQTPERSQTREKVPPIKAELQGSNLLDDQFHDEASYSAESDESLTTWEHVQKYDQSPKNGTYLSNRDFPYQCLQANNHRPTKTSPRERTAASKHIPNLPTLRPDAQSQDLDDRQSRHQSKSDGLNQDSAHRQQDRSEHQSYDQGQSNAQNQDSTQRQNRSKDDQNRDQRQNDDQSQKHGQGQDAEPTKSQLDIGTGTSEYCPLSLLIFALFRGYRQQ